MPLYEYQCECGNQFDEFKSVPEYCKNSKSEPCDTCGSKNTKRILSTSAIIEDIEPYKSTITGERIRGRSHHRSHLKQHGYEEVGTDNLEESKKIFTRPNTDKADKQRRIEDATRAYEAAEKHA